MKRDVNGGSGWTHLVATCAIAFLLVACQSGSPRGYVSILGGDLGVPANCPGQVCTFRFQLSLKPDGSCNSVGFARPQVSSGTVVNWIIANSQQGGYRFDKQHGVFVANNDGYFVCQRVSTEHFRCTRTSKPTGGQVPFAYNVNVHYTFESEPRLCFIDPLIVSLD